MTMVQRQIGALLVDSPPFFADRRDEFIALAARYRMPAMYDQGLFPAAGGLTSYGADQDDAWRQSGVYVGRILKGEKPADLPVQQSTKVELIINLKTAKALGLTVPLALQASANELIE
jgi:putative ABC transport system substrate-binding protein